MTSGKNTKRAMLASALSLALCCAMLLGTTFAWFTDSVTNTGNIIQSGNLNITATVAEVDPDDTAFTIQNDATGEAVNGGRPFGFGEPRDIEKVPGAIIGEKNWEPGRSDAKLLTVTNSGTLAAKVKLQFSVTDGGLSEALWYDFIRVVDGAVDGTFTKRPMNTLKSMEALEFPLLESGDNLQFILVYGMYEEAGNEFQGDSFAADVTILAKQTPKETDGFGSNQYDAAAPYAWSGGTDDEGLEGNTDAQAKAVSIETPEQMASFAAAVNAGNTYKDYTVTLEKDLDLGGENWTPIGRSGHTFQGVFDGNGHTVSNLKVDMATSSDVGFFGFTQGGEIRNLTIHNAQVKGYLDVGVVAGTPYTSAYSNIKLTGTIQVDGYAYVGGMFGKNAYADLSDLTIDAVEGSYVKAESEEYRTYVGGVVGFMGEGRQSVSNVVSNIDVYGSTCDVGGITGIAHYGNTFANCISTGDVYLTNSIFDENKLEIGGIAGTWMNSSAGSVTLRGCSFTGTLHAVHNEQDISGEVAGNTLTGSKYYPDSNEGQLIIE